MSKRDIAIRIIAGALAVIVLAWFAYANSGESVDLDFLLFTLSGVSLSVVIYGAVIVGMLAVLAIGLRADLRLRRRLRRQGWSLPTEGPDRKGAPSKSQAGDVEVGEETIR